MANDAHINGLMHLARWQLVTLYRALNALAEVLNDDPLTSEQEHRDIIELRHLLATAASRQHQD
jgi:hypothetical protein